MASVNKVTLLGNAGRDPEVRYLPSGQAVANVSLATTSKYKDKQDQWVEDTQWHRITFYERLAEIAGEYIKKGSQFYVEGRIKYGKYTGQDGVEKNTVDIIATNLVLLGSPQGGGQQGGQDERQRPQQGQQRPQQGSQGGGTGGGYGSHRGGQDNRAPARRPAAAPNPNKGGGFDDLDEDIPF